MVNKDDYDFCQFKQTKNTKKSTQTQEMDRASHFSHKKHFPYVSTTWSVFFCGLDLYAWFMSTIQATLTPGGD